MEEDNSKDEEKDAMGEEEAVWGREKGGLYKNLQRRVIVVKVRVYVGRLEEEGLKKILQGQSPKMQKCPRKK